MTEAKKLSNKKYKANVKRFTVDFTPSELELYEHLNSQEKKQTYIKALIKADINKGREL